MAAAGALAFCENDVDDRLRAGFHAKSSFGEMTRQARHGCGFDEKAATVPSKRSLDATKWNRGVSQHAHDRVGGSLDGGRRLVMVAKPEPFCGSDCQEGIAVGAGVACLAARVATLRVQAIPRVPLGIRGLPP